MNMKKIIVVAMLGLFGTALFANPTEVNEKVLKIFKTTFAKATDVKWTEFENSYSVSFSMDGIQSKVVYDKEGNMESSMRYYTPDKLPANIYGKLKKKYDNRTFFGVTESSTDQETTYYVKMYDAKNWYTIKIDSGGSMETYEKLKRADIGQIPDAKPAN